MSLSYQRIDRKVCDYDLWYLPGFRLPLRGPRRWRQGGDYVTFVGAAQTFGRFAPDPYPAQISRWFDVDHLNLGLAGAGPAYFLETEWLLERINESRLCFLQVMSGRSVSTSLLRAVSKGAVLEFTRGPAEGKRLPAADAYAELLAHYDPEDVLAQVAEARRNWVHAYRQLIDAIEPPVVLIWVSSRTPDFDLDLSSAHNLLGVFPQLVDRASFDAISEGCDAVVEATFPRERPQLLVNITTRRAQPVYVADDFPRRREWSRAYNVYYPSPAMHSFVARSVIGEIGDSPELRALLEGGNGG